MDSKLCAVSIAAPLDGATLDRRGAAMRRHLAPVLATALALLLFVFSAPAGAAMAVTIANPTQGALAGFSLNVSVTVTSTYSVSSVHAQVDTVGADLSPGATWTGTLAIGPLTPGAKTLTVTATDLFSNTATATVGFTHDNPPVITVTSPIDETVARPDVSLSATCTDDDPGGCLNFQAYLGPPPMPPWPQQPAIATGTGSINASTSLASSAGQTQIITFSAVDSANQVTTVSVTVIVDTSPNLGAGYVVPGVVLDFDGRRILYRKPDGSVVIRDVGTSTDTTIGTALSASSLKVTPVGWLTSVGAAWISLPGGYPDPMAAYEWRAGQATNFTNGSSTDVSSGYLQVNGDWAFFAIGRTLRNLATGTEATITWPTYQGPASMGTVMYWALAPNGDVFGFGQDPSTQPMTCPVVRYHDGAFSTIGTVAKCDSFPRGTVTDGVSVVYTGEVAGLGSYQTAMMDLNGVETNLGAVRSSYQIGGNGLPGTGWAATSGWVAFLKQDVSLVQQVWTRSPQGMLAQISPFSSDSFIETLNGAGEVMFLTSTERYFGIAGSLPTPISPPSGRSVSACGKWYVLLGTSVLEVAGVDPDAGTTGCAVPDAGGAPDASAGDAGVSDATSDAAPDGAGAGGNQGTSSGGGGSSTGGVGGGSSTGAAGGGSSTGAAGGAGGAPVRGSSCSLAQGGQPAGRWLALGLLGLVLSLGRRRRLRGRPSRAPTSSAPVSTGAPLRSYTASETRSLRGA
jgi:hypothetical protein